MKKFLFTAHLLIGLCSALVLVVLGVSGTIIAFEPELNRLLHPELTKVEVTGPVMNWDLVKGGVEEQAPGWKLNRFYFADAPTYATYARIRSVSTHRTRQIYVNQYTGKILGSTEDGPDLLIKIHDLHVNLLTGGIADRPGSVVVMAGTYCLLILSLTGIVLWFPRKVFRFHKGSPGPRLNRDLHMSLGFWSSLAMFAFALTGIGLHYQTGKLLKLLNRPDNAIVRPGHGTSIEAMLQTARETLPGAEIPRLLLSEKAGDPVFIYQRFPEDKTPAGRSFTTLDPRTGNILSVGSSRTTPPMQAALVLYTREIHTGTLLGLPTRVLAALLGFCLPVLAITGPIIWINKQRAKWHGRRVLVKRAAADKEAPLRVG
ncbi:MAG: PepSY domain-containing protein [Acidobacteriota bacterium]|nr:PepSY domain-containing protein [Acidobacteriota bacterium]